MNESDKAEVTLPSDTEVRVTRRFHAPRRKVYRAYTEPALLQRWLLGPPGWTMPVCEMDVREGGTFRWRWRGDEDGQEFGFHGEFLEVVPEARIVHSEFYDPGDVGGNMGDGMKVSVTFGEKDGVTTVTTTMEFKSQEDRDAAMATGMTDGMEQSYQNLDAMLRERR
ncbi:MAG TPA: SRPBCC family protein [Woeseiaceae bacterium]|nr:SRPBCC family protein [Woeseiaceae bacterium]